MRLLIELDYTKVLFAKDCNYAEIIRAIEGVTIVEEVGPYGNLCYKAKEGVDVSIKLLADTDVRLPDVPRPESVDRLLSMAKERDALKTKVYALEAELKKIKDTIAPVASA